MPVLQDHVHWMRFPHLVNRQRYFTGLTGIAALVTFVIRKVSCVDPASDEIVFF